MLCSTLFYNKDSLPFRYSHHRFSTLHFGSYVYYYSYQNFRGFNTEIAMRRAMHNVESHYAVVGVLEDLNKTLTVLEHYVPRFFKGALNTYWSKFKNNS